MKIWNIELTRFAQDSKLKKEENQELIKKLSQQNVDLSLLRSSKKLGRGQDTAREALSLAVRQQRAGIHHGVQEDTTPSSSSEEDRVVRSPVVGSQNSYQNGGNSQAGPKPEPDEEPTIAAGFGRGLKRPLPLSEDGQPIIQQRKRHKLMKAKPDFRQHTQQDVPSESSEWEGLSSDTSRLSNISESSVSVDEEPSDMENLESDSPGTDASDTGDEGLQERSSAFKAWADMQRNAATNFTPIRGGDMNVSKSTQPVTSEDVSTFAKKTQQPQPSSSSPHLTLSSERKVYNVKVHRSPDIELSRQQLPVVAKEQEIMETIFNNDVTILSGSTGSGKTTQVPQFLFEAGYGGAKSLTPGMIGVTQPRRIAAVSMASRVAHELGNLKEQISHQVRFDTSVNEKTAIKFMTDGILLREISHDFTLSKYSCIIIDEAHERTVNTDLLIGMLSRIVETRRKLSNQSGSSLAPLKLIIMSATLKISELTGNANLFRNSLPPVVDVEGKQYHVTAHFARKTEHDYVEEMVKKVSRGHRKLPAGGILVFLTGQNEIDYVRHRLASMFKDLKEKPGRRDETGVSAKDRNVQSQDLHAVEKRRNSFSSDELNEVDDQNEGDSEQDDFVLEAEESASIQNVHILPLYSQLPAEQQAQVFEDPPTNSRLIVLATNVAETSLTIPNIRYVFDCGRHKCKRYNIHTGVQSFAIDWISKASAQQRTGRAGRTGPGGHCYRLYSSAVYEDAFPDFADPEIVQTPVESVVLSLKNMGIPDVTKFPFPTPPSSSSLKQAERLLQHLSALEPATGNPTPLGHQLSTYPTSPRLARILVLSRRDSTLLPYAVTLVAALSVPDIFIPHAALDFGADSEQTSADWHEQDRQDEQLKKDYTSFHSQVARLDRSSDGIKQLTTLTTFLQGQDVNLMDKFHKFTRTKALHEASQLRSQLITLTSNASVSTSLTSKPSKPLQTPSKSHLLSLRALIAAGYIDNVAQRADLSPTPSHSKRKNSSTQVPYIPLFPVVDMKSISTKLLKEMDEKTNERLKYVFIHPASVLAHVQPSKLPRFVVYSHLSTTGGQSLESLLDTEMIEGTQVPRIRMHPLTPVTADILIELSKGTILLKEGKPIGKVETLKRSEKGEERRAVYTIPYLNGGHGVEWPLPPARRIVQRRVSGRGWVEQ